jgi:hypothetical protein
MVPCAGRLNASPENVIIWISNSLTINQLLVNVVLRGKTGGWDLDSSSQSGS